MTKRRFAKILDSQQIFAFTGIVDWPHNIDEKWSVVFDHFMELPDQVMTISWAGCGFKTFESARAGMFGVIRRKNYPLYVETCDGVLAIFKE